jgi:biopolymer transport protein ExbB/TolQ
MSTMEAWYREGGPIMLLIALVAVVGLAILIERLYVIVFRSKNNGRVFIERVIQLVRVGRIDEAIKVCAGSTAALPDIGLLILRSRSRDEADLQNVAGAALLFVVPKLTRRLQYLRSLAVAAILLGILGTARGIHDTLIAAGAAAARAEQMFASLGASLTPTMFGLAVSIVLTIGGGYLVSQSECITEEIREFSARLINALIDRPDVRLGHR